MKRTTNGKLARDRAPAELGPSDCRQTVSNAGEEHGRTGEADGGQTWEDRFWLHTSSHLSAFTDLVATLNKR